MHETENEITTEYILRPISVHVAIQDHVLML